MNEIIRALLPCEQDFWNGFSIGLLLNDNIIFNINDGKISEIGIREEN